VKRAAPGGERGPVVGHARLVLSGEPAGDPAGPGGEVDARGLRLQFPAGGQRGCVVQGDGELSDRAAGGRLVEGGLGDVGLTEQLGSKELAGDQHSDITPGGSRLGAQ